MRSCGPRTIRSDEWRTDREWATHPFPYLIDPARRRSRASLKCRNVHPSDESHHQGRSADAGRSQEGRGPTKGRSRRHHGHGPWATIPKTWRSVRSAGFDVSGQQCRIAVVDDAVDTRHAEFAGRVAGQWDAATGAESSIPSGWQPHGTKVAGLALAGGIEVTGVAPAALLLAVRVSALSTHDSATRAKQTEFGGPPSMARTSSAARGGRNLTRRADDFPITRGTPSTGP